VDGDSTSANDPTVEKDMNLIPIRHQHTATITHVLRQRHGVPYETERVVCEACKKLLAERDVRRAAA
jgi:hypothetical protein